MRLSTERHHTLETDWAASTVLEVVMTAIHKIAATNGKSSSGSGFSRDFGCFAAMVAPMM